MKLWRLTRQNYVALDGAGAAKSGGRYSSPGIPLVNFASEPGLAVLVALRYVQATPAFFADEFVLSWTTIDCPVERVPGDVSSVDKVIFVDTWAAQR